MKYKFLTLLLFIAVFIEAQTENGLSNSFVKSDVLLQGYYWNCTPGGVWWDTLTGNSANLASALFDGVLIPSPSKGSSGKFSMGYDIYDHYDLGDYYQQGTTETRFGSKKKLLKLVEKLKAFNLNIYSDIVLGYVTGGEQFQKYECSPKGIPDSSKLIFNYPNGSGRFKKDATFFYPNSGYCESDLFRRRISKIGDQKPEYFAFNRLFVQDSLIEYAKFLHNELNLSGFRLFQTNFLDVKFLETWIKTFSKQNIKSILDFTGDKNSQNILLADKDLINNSDVLIFDYELRNAFFELCNDKKGVYDLSKLDDIGLINKGIKPDKVLHFVETTEFDRTNYENTNEKSLGNIIRNKKYAYSYILFTEGIPSVFYRDYFHSDLRDYINKLILARAKYIKGKTLNRFDINAFFIRDDKKQNQSLLSKDIYILHRSEKEDGSGAYLIINDSPTNAFQILSDTELPVGFKLKNITGGSSYAEVVKARAPGLKNKIRFVVSPATAVVFVTDSYIQLNNPPAIQKNDDIVTYTDTDFEFFISFSDANKDELTFELNKAPNWLNLDEKGALRGTPGFFDIGTQEVIVSIKDVWGFSVSDTFNITVKRNTAPIIGTQQDKFCLVAQRFNTNIKAFDSDGDSLSFYLDKAPNWLSIGENTGILSGTPGVKDTGLYKIKVLVKDSRGGKDSTLFKLNVRLDPNTPINTYLKPIIDGVIEATDNDWRDDWLLYSDEEEDGVQNFNPSPNNDIFSLYATWDSDSLYFGAEYIIEKDKSFIIYIDAGFNEGIKDFSTTGGYLGDYPFNVQFADSVNIDYFLIQNNAETFNIFECFDNKTTSFKSKVNGIVNKNNSGAEFSIAWDDFYGLGAGIIPQNTELSLIGVIIGGRNTNPIDSAPDNENVSGSDKPCYLGELVKISPDLNGDGIADPTTTVYAKKIVPFNTGGDNLKLYQNYPNPFNGNTTIFFEVKYPSHVQLKVYDVLGREVTEIVNRYMPAGSYKFDFDASNLPSGTYFYRLKGSGSVDVKKMILIK
ncbi:MAG TPA: putative Ig domain-containing protein [Melioribacteraceae bacterium]|nr:putative Ig domain-containing protein [Melioribacteraceae bacterium]